MSENKHSTIDNIKAAYKDKQLNIYTAVSNDVADEIGIPQNSNTRGYNDERDAFRHAYTSAIVSMRWGNTVSDIAGKANELKNHFPGGQVAEHEEWMDNHNNAKGLEIAQKVKSAGGSEEDVKYAVKEALGKGDLITTPYDPRRTYEKHGNWQRAKTEAQQLMQQDKQRMEDEARAKNNGVLSEESKQKINSRFKSHQQDYKKTEETYNPDKKEASPKAKEDEHSFLDGTGDALGAAGSALRAAGGVAFDVATRVGKDTLVHAVTQSAMQGDGGKAVLANAAKIAMTQTLSNMHGLVMQEVEKNQGSPFRTPGIAGPQTAPVPIPQPDGKTRESIERTVNDPRNAGIFNEIATRVENILKQVDSADPAAVLVSKVMETLRGGNIKVQPHILVPDMFPQEDGPVREAKGDKERVIEVAGVHIPVKLPEVRVIMDEGGAVGIPGRTPDFNPNTDGGLHRGADGAIEVKGYTRADGTQVRGYTRTGPDGIESNNLSFKR